LATEELNPQRTTPVGPTRTDPRTAVQAPAVTPAKAPWTWIYHSVGAYSEDPYQIAVTPERFARQLSWLHCTGLRGVSMGELLRAHAEGRAAGMVGLTFDDGYADLLSEALPALERYGFTATAFIVAGRLGGQNDWDPDGPQKPLLTLEQVRLLGGSRIEIGSHGLLHRSLPGLAPEVLEMETLRSRELLEAIVERSVTGFCYPYGAVDRTAMSAVRNGGYDYAVAINHGRLSGRWALPRTFVGERDSEWRLRAKRARHRVRGLYTRTDGKGAC
jgi:peptidoglycan/xylan/chitin deacetylase (PgdA/CDA1 family)